MEKITAVIITRNEEKNITDCLRALDFVEDIIVVDCGSSDKTVLLAREYTKNIFFHEWSGYAEQKNYGISLAKSEWILSIDADERVTKKLKKEIIELDFTAEGYYFPRKNYFLGKWLKHGRQYPDHQLRLFRRSAGKFSYESKDVHETVKLPPDKTAKLNNPMLHFSYNSIPGYFHKYDCYTYLDANGRFRRNFKPSLYGIFIRPVNRFIKWYLIKLGFLDGLRGLLYYLFSSFYIFTAEKKLFKMYHRHNDNKLKN